MKSLYNGTTGCVVPVEIFRHATMVVVSGNGYLENDSLQETDKTDTKRLNYLHGVVVLELIISRGCFRNGNVYIYYQSRIEGYILSF